MDSLAARIYKPWIALPIIRTLNGLHEEQLKSLEIVSQVIPKQVQLIIVLQRNIRLF